MTTEIAQDTKGVCLIDPFICRPLVGSFGTPCFPGKQSTFVGHLSIDKVKVQMQREMVCLLCACSFSLSFSLSLPLPLPLPLSLSLSLTHTHTHTHTYRDRHRCLIYPWSLMTCLFLYSDLLVFFFPEASCIHFTLFTA